jgi:hypothetical protein
MKDEYRYDSTHLHTGIVDLLHIATNMIYDPAPRLPEADLPIIVIQTEKMQKPE